jgi:YesN/AraC family two-component response regulator
MKKRTILIVDDEPIARKALISAVTWEKFGIDRIFDVGSAAAAKEILEKETVDFALIDIEMPVENGLQFVEWMRTTKGLQIPCAFLTCHASFDYAKQAIRLNCMDYLLKPANQTEIEALISKMLESQFEKNEREEYEKYGKQWILEKEQEGHRHEKQVSNTDEIVEELVDYIRLNIASDLNLTKLAKHASLNLNYLNRVFKKQTGETINKFIINERMQLAARLLKEGNLKSYAVAEMVGYNNYTNFVNMFKKTYGISPSSYADNEKVEKSEDGSRET